MKKASRIAVVLLGIVSLLSAGRINGFVTDIHSGEAMIGANVFLKNTSYGTATDFNGYYVINDVPDGEHTLIVSYLGYEYSEQSVYVNGNDDLVNVALKEKAVELEAVTVDGEKISRQVAIEPSRVSLSPRELKSLPSIVEPDIFRTIQAMPGVLTPSEFSTGLVIRGGNTDQNLILLDGITVYNPSHLGGIFSNFLIDAVKEADLIKGGYNAEYGGRLSAVLNILSREGNRKHFDAKGSVSLLSAQTTMEGPFYNGAWLVSARRTYFDKVLKGTPYYIPYYFYDMQGHVFTDFTAKDRLSFSFYKGLDDLVFDDFGLTANWGNDTYSLAFRKVFTDRLIANFLAANSTFQTYFGLGGSSGVNSTNLIDDQTASADFTYFHNQDMNVKFGGQMKRLGFEYNTSYNDSTLLLVKVKPVEASGYVKTKWVPTPRFVIEPGFRLNFYSGNDQKFYPDFRLGLKYIVETDVFINAAIGNYHQFLETVQDDFNPTILDQWLAIDNSVESASSVQYVLGLEQYIDNNWHLQIEGYYKDIKNMLTYEESAATSDAEVDVSKLSNTFTPSDGYAYGFETFIQRTTGKLTGWIAYTWSVSRKVLNGTEYFTNWDRRHAFNIIGTWQFKPKWELNGRWTWQSGQAYTPILGYYVENLPLDENNRYRTIPGWRNSGRYPDYHRLDLSLIRHFKIGSSKLDLSLQVINAYNRANIFQYIYQLGSTTNGLDDDNDWTLEDDIVIENGYPDAGEPHVDEEDEGIIRREETTIFPLIPSIGISLEL